MTREPIELRLRLALLSLASFAFVATIGELSLIGHAGSSVQLLPFLLAGAGLAVTLAALLRPGPATFRALRWTMAIVLGGSLFGVAEHLWGNAAFAHEIRPSTSGLALVWAALTGANPVLAPGMLGFAGLVAGLAGWRHPHADREPAGRSVVLAGVPGRAAPRSRS